MRRKRVRNRPFNVIGYGLIAAFLAQGLHAQESESADRGKNKLLGVSYIQTLWPATAYHDAWKAWGIPAPPRDYDQAVQQRYGLYPAPFDNGPYPMGLRKGPGRDAGIAIDCLLCHAGSVFGQTLLGLPNTALDIEALFQDFGKVSARGAIPITMGHVRGTTEAGNLGVFLLSLRSTNLGLRYPPLDLKIGEFLIGDAPAWWLLRKKQTMYHTGIADARSVRALMQFLLSPSASQATLAAAEQDFRHIQSFILSLRPPKYPFAIDRDLAAKGEEVFNDACEKCHGTYGERWTYPNKITPIENIGTDRTRYDGLSREWAEHYNRTWFAQETRDDGKVGYPIHPPRGYQAPPLDGVWATAPYLHNGSVPTLYGVLNSGARPKIFVRTFGTNESDYDTLSVGWKVRELAPDDAIGLPAFERRKVYDTTAPGRGNGGHLYGDRLSEEQRRAVIEYLKTL